MTQSNSEKEKKVSSCCGAAVGTHYADEGTNFYYCNKCKKPCDPAPQPSEEETKRQCEYCEKMHRRPWTQADLEGAVRKANEMQRETVKEPQLPVGAWEVHLAPEGTPLVRFQKERTDAISEMFDGEYADGIYPTSKFFARLDKCFADEIKAAHEAGREEGACCKKHRDIEFSKGQEAMRAAAIAAVEKIRFPHSIPSAKHGSSWDMEKEWEEQKDNTLQALKVLNQNPK